jgi:predicted dehydrogenase
VLNDDSIDAIVIATPVDSHYPLAKLALEHNKHVLVEKPLTDNYAQALELVDMAKERGKLLMVDHTFLYTGAVRYLKKYAESGDLGNIHYIDSTRINLGLFQHDVNVLWDLAPHDISICHYLINRRPESVQATGISHTFNGIENIAYLTLKFENNILAHFNCSWVSPVKMRTMLIGGDKKMIVFNDMEPTEKIKVYDTGFKVHGDEDKNEFIADYRMGDILVPKIDYTEALSLMAQDFVDSIEQDREPVSNAELGLAVVEILDAAQRSISSNGAEIEIGQLTV